MAYKTFSGDAHDTLKEPMFFGKNINLARYDIQKYPVFEKITEKQLSFFWRPEEIDVSKDSKDFATLPDHEQHIFLSNLKYQTLLDSVQGRSPNVAFLPIVSLPELEVWIETWAFSETIHSRSYTHILRNLFTNPSTVFDNIVNVKEIAERARSVTTYYDKLIDLVHQHYTKSDGRFALGQDGYSVNTSLETLQKALYLTLVSVNVLEGIRFYVSFACSFAFAERKLMEGNAKIIRLIARDEALHLTGTQQLINIIKSGKEGEAFAQIAKNCEPEAREIFIEAANQEKEWASYLFKDGSMLGLNTTILGQYVEHLTDVRMKSVGLKPEYGSPSNPLPWMNNWLVSDNVQVAPQETEISSYLVGQIDSSVSSEDLSNLSL
jgi:ribonucleoside-diphosphate reductase beta chain